MFTGLIEETGRITEVRRGTSAARLVVQGTRVGADSVVGDSISVNGICLTVASKHGVRMVFDVVPETFQRTSLRTAKVGDGANLERALPVGGRIGGHFVLGHVDATGRLDEVSDRETAKVLRISAPPEVMRLMVAKGSVALDGISLTVVDVDDASFTVWIVPHTYRNTAMRERKVGEAINIEVDILGKYVDRLIGGYEGARGITAEQLERAGFGAPAGGPE